MNIIIANEYKNSLDNLDIDVIKSITGEYSGYDISEMFQSLYFEKLILDSTSMKDNLNISTYKDLLKNISSDKIIILLKENTEMCSPKFLSQLINIGIYNFTSKIDGIKYLINKPNSFEDVKEIFELGKSEIKEEQLKASMNNNTQTQNSGEGINLNIVIGIKNITKGAGATTLSYILKKELEKLYKDKVICIEINKKDFSYFNEKNMISVTEDKLKENIDSYKGKSIIIIDYGEYDDYSLSSDMLFLIEPSTLKLNKLMKLNSSVLAKLKLKKVILNKSLLTEKDVSEFEYESGLKIFYNLTPLDERKSNEIVYKLICKLGLAVENSNKQTNSKIFGLFKR